MSWWRVMANRKFNRTKSKVSRRGGALSNRATCPCPCLIATRTCPAVMGGSAASARTAAAAASVCEHGRRRSQCKDCGGSGLCEHGRRRSQCKECGGSSFCEHGRERSRCKDCGGSGICEHGRQRSQCKEYSGQVTFLEATEDEEKIDEDDEPSERLPTVQAHAVAPRGGKRKR